jgi:hypothetical protein
LRIVDSAANLDATVRALPLLRESGVDEIIVDADWTQPTSLPDVYGVLRNAGE